MKRTIIGFSPLDESYRQLYNMLLEYIQKTSPVVFISGGLFMDTVASSGAYQPEEGELAKQAGEQHSSDAILPNAEVERRAKVFSALGNETRLKILRLLSSGDLCVSEIVESVAGAASTVAHHLRMLEDAGLVTSRRDGRSTYYTVQEEELIKYHIFE